MEDNSFLVDIETLGYLVHNRTSGDMKLYLGKFVDGEFQTTINSIKDLDIIDQEKIKEHIRSTWVNIKYDYDDTPRSFQI